MLGPYVQIQTHHGHELDAAETRLMIDLELTDKLFCVTFNCGEQQLGTRAGAEQDEGTKSADAVLLSYPRLN